MGNVVSLARDFWVASHWMAGRMNGPGPLPMNLENEGRNKVLTIGCNTKSEAVRAACYRRLRLDMGAQAVTPSDCA